MTGILMASVGNSYGSAPVNTVAPVVSGTATVGQTLSTTNGTWLGAPAPTFTYQWQRTGVDIGGATSSTYVLVAADYANTIRCVVRATNSVAPAGVTANSNSTASVAGNAPVNTVAPAVTGTATVGQTLSTTNGTWTGVPTPTFTYQWQRVTTNISGATSSTYVLVAADVGNTIRCVVTATNAVSAVSANSNSTAAVAASVPGAPTIGTATQTGATTATVAYTAPASNGGATITLYTATSSPGGITGTLATAGSGTITVSGLTTGTAYTFTVKATNSVGQSAASAASNSVTPTAVGFLATEKYSTYIYNTSRYVAVNSSGTIYKVPDGGSGNGIVSMIQYSSTGTQNWNRHGYNGQYTLAVGVDSSNNYYPVGTFDSSNVQLSKYNSSDTLQWSRSYPVAAARPDTINRPLIDSSGNVYINYREAIVSCCCPTYYVFNMTKLDSSGTFQLGRSFDGGGGQYIVGYGGVGLDSSANIYNVFSGIAYPYGSIIIYKSSSAGTALATSYVTRANTQGGSRSGGYFAGGYVFDTTNSVGYVSGSGAGGLIYKHNTSLGHVWAYTYSNTTAFQGIALDSSGNMYVVGYTSGISGTTRIMKVDSSGTVQWARTLSASGGYYVEYQYYPAQISVVGTKFVICVGLTNGSDRIAFTFQAPTDGSGTGTFTNAGQTWTYASFATTATANDTNVSGAGGQGSITATTTSRTPTIATSLWATSTTSF